MADCEQEEERYEVDMLDDVRGRMAGETADEFSTSSFLQNSQASSGVTDSCEGSQVYPPTPPIMLQVNQACCIFSEKT